MNAILFFLTLNLVLISRLGLTFRDEGASTGSILKMAILPLIALLFIEISAAWFILLGYLLLYPLMIIFLERSPETIYRNRLISLVVHSIVLYMIFSPLLDIGMKPILLDLLSGQNQHAGEEILSILILLFGGLLVMNEMNTLLRYSFKLLKLDPIGKVDEPVTDQQYNTGRIIGMLERIFIFVFAVTGQFTAIGFILTAKGVVRYKEFESRTFAEYVLIGTLLSALLALLTALAVKGFIYP